MADWLMIVASGFLIIRGWCLCADFSVTQNCTGAQEVMYETFMQLDQLLGG